MIGCFLLKCTLGVVVEMSPSVSMFTVLYLLTFFQRTRYFLTQLSILGLKRESCQSANVVYESMNDLFCLVCLVPCFWATMEASGAPSEDLLQRPWLPVSISGCQLLAKSWFGETAYHVLLTDMHCVWEERMDSAAIQKRAQVQATLSKWLIN